MRASAPAKEAVQLGGAGDTGLRVPVAASNGRRRVPLEGIVLGGGEAAALPGAHVQQRRTRARAQRDQRVDQCLDVVAIDGARVGNAERLGVAAHVSTARQAADVGRDRHAVLVVDDAQRRGLAARWPAWFSAS